MRKRKTKRERLVEHEYRKILKEMEGELGNGVTFSDDLDKIATKYLGIKFKGVYPSDRIPKLNELEPYAILNLDGSDLPGSHWIAAAYDNSNGAERIQVYDSYGRKSSDIIPNIYNGFGGRIDDGDDDKHQRIREDNCGQRSLAWLIIHNKDGPDTANLI